MEETHELFGNQKTEDIIQILEELDWNWFLAADHLNCDPEKLKESFSSYHRTDIDILEAPKKVNFGAAHIRSQDVQKLQDFVKTNLSQSMPLLFDSKLSEEKKKEMAQKVLLEMGLPWKLTHAPQFVDNYRVLEDEALQLIKWRNQVQYLTIVEEALFKISVAEAQKSKQNENSSSPSKDEQTNTN